MNQRGIAPSDVHAALTQAVAVLTQSNGNHLFIGQNGIGVVVDAATGEIVTVLNG